MTKCALTPYVAKCALTPYVVMVVGLVLSIGMSAPAAGEPAGLVGRWGFDDGTGKDLSGNGNDAVLGGTRIYSLGKGHACIELMPDAERMRIPASKNSPLAISRGTICFWVNVAWGKPHGCP